MLTALLVLASLAQSPVVVSPAGTYSITTRGPTTIAQTATSITLSWTAPAPAPAPAPEPVPPVPVPPAPAPAPIPVLTGHVWALAIYDSAATLPAAQQAALNSPTIKASALLQDIDFQAYKSTDSGVATWLPHLPKSGLPALERFTNELRMTPRNTNPKRERGLRKRSPRSRFGLV